MSAEAKERYTAAQELLRAGDGKRCLAELDRHDELDPKHPSTEASSGLDPVRPECLMLAGQCDAGKALARKYLEQRGPGKYPDFDAEVDSLVGQYCRGKMSPRDELLTALNVVVEGYLRGQVEAPRCEKAYFTAKRLLKTVKPKNDQDRPIAGAADGLHVWAASCAAKAHDCETAYRLFKDGFQSTPAYARLKTPQAREQYIRTGFHNSIGAIAGECKQ